MLISGKRTGRTQAPRARHLYRHRGAVGCIPCQRGRAARTHADAWFPRSL